MNDGTQWIVGIITGNADEEVLEKPLMISMDFISGIMFISLEICIVHIEADKAIRLKEMRVVSGILAAFDEVKALFGEIDEV